jgi:zinc transporter 5/7
MMGRVQVWIVEAPLRWSRLPRDGRRLVTYVSMLAALSVLELTAGIATGDGALAWDATHTLVGCAVLTLSLRALVRKGDERPPRVEVTAAFAVSCFLAFTTLQLLIEGWRMRGGGNTLFSEERYPSSLMAPSTARVAIDVLGAAMFFKGAQWIGDFASAREMNLHAVFLFALADGFRSARVPIAQWVHDVMGGESQNTEWGECMFAAAVIVYNAHPLILRTAAALFGAKPRSRVESLAKCELDLRRIPGVVDVIESASWMTAPGELVANVTLRVTDGVDDAVVMKAARGVYNATVGTSGVHVDCVVTLERDRGRDNLPK